ncbi:MAG: helix-turn-helix transcriptional regulator [Dehalococcoidia bacterium]
MLSGAQVAAIRKQRGWSQQYLALQSGVNKAYISEYESGVRSTLPPDMIQRISAILLADPAGHISPSIEDRGGRLRLILRDAQGNEVLVPNLASVRWTEADGSTYSMYLGEIEPD